MRVRILLADHSEAEFYDMLKADGKPKFASGLGDPLAHLRSQWRSHLPDQIFNRLSPS